MKLKNLLIVVVLGLILLAGAGLWWIKKNAPVVTPGTQTQVSETFEVTEKVGETNIATLSAKKDETPMSLLGRTFKATVKKYSFGSMVDSINNIPNGKDKKFWIYYVNGKVADVGADQYKLQPGDIIEWKFEAEKK